MKDLIADAKQRMHASRGDGAPRAVHHAHRPCLAGHAGRHPRGLLRHAHAAEPGGQPLHARPHPITIQPWDPSLLPAIEKAIRTSDLDLNPQNDGKIIRIPVPSLTEERRKTLVKHAHKHAEEGRVAVRNVRRDVNDHLKKLLKDHEVSEDDEKHAMTEVQKLTDQHVEQINEILKKKEAEIMEVWSGPISLAPYNRASPHAFTRLDCTRCDARYPPGEPAQPLRVRRAALRALRPGARGQEHAARPPRAARAHAVALRRRAARGQPRPPHQPGRGLHAPAVRAAAWARCSGLPRLYVKDEGGNPTGSFKARGLCLAVSMAKALGATDVCLPVGRQRGQRAGRLRGAGRPARRTCSCPRDVAPRLRDGDGRPTARRWSLVDGLITDAGKVCAERAREDGWYDCATLKEPYRVEGKKTMGYELAEQMGWKLPDAILYPTGGGTGLIGMWKAFEEMETHGLRGPGAPAHVRGAGRGLRAHREGLRRGPRAKRPSGRARATHAHGLRVPKPLADFLILRALRESHGAAVAVSEAEIIQGVKDAAAAEGLFMAPEGGACVAALRKLKASGHLSADDTVVVFNTGTGFKYVENMAPLW